MWKRNLLFLGAAATLWANLVPPRIARARKTPESPPGPGRNDGEIVARVNEAFRGEWSEQGPSAAPRAPELAAFRRLTLALMGTVPSLEEIREFEARPAGRRLGPQLDEMLRDRRFADDFAERLAREAPDQWAEVVTRE
jgi:hypothetical protein